MRREVPCAPATTHGLLLLDQEPQTSGHFRLDLPPDFAHPANRTRQPSLRGSERVLLTSDAAHKATRLHAYPRFRTQASDDRRDIQLMHLGELPRSQLVIRVVPAPVVSCAQGNGRQIGGLLAQPVRPGVGRLDATRPMAHRAGEGPDPLEVSGTSGWFHPQLLRNECRPTARPAPGTSAPPSIAALIERLSTLTSGRLTCSRTAERCSISSPSSNRCHVTAGSFSRRIRYSAGMADSSVTSTEGGQARRLKVVVFPSSLGYFPLLSGPRPSMVPIT